MAVVGLVLALWSLTGAMQTLMWALNEAYDRDETRGFVKRRLTGLAMVVLLLLAFALAFGLLVLGPHLSGWIGSAVGADALVQWRWWTAQWPILLLGLLLAFATILYLGPDVDHPRWSFLTIGTGLAVVVWLAASGAFAVYASRFGAYDKTWGSLGIVIIMLTWLWLSSLALLLGAEVNAEAERSRELRRGEPAESTLPAPPKGRAARLRRTAVVVRFDPHEAGGVPPVVPAVPSSRPTGAPYDRTLRRRDGSLLPAERGLYRNGFS